MTNQTQRSPSLACCARLIEKAQYPAFLKAIEYCEGMIDGGIETTAIQRAFGFTYETEKAFQTAVKMNVETVPPSENLLKFMLERRIRLEGYVSRVGASVTVQCKRHPILSRVESEPPRSNTQRLPKR